MSAAAPVFRVFNVKYSPNLGDGLLSECLEAALIGQGASGGTRSIDLAARESYGDGMAGRGKIMTVLDMMPGWLRHHVVRAPLALASKRRWRPHYDAQLKGADAVLIGGGNLLSDHDLNFPTKLALALDQAAGLPVAIYGCGMAEHWTDEGDRRLRRALKATPPRAVFLRDEASCARWDARFGDVSGQRAQVVRDPGMMAAETYGPVVRDGPLTVGLGIMSHVAIRYHAEASQSQDALAQWYVAVAEELIGRGVRVVGFTNGAPEDRSAAEAIAPQLTALGAEMRAPERPSDLSDIVGGCHAIVAYRMHAVIAAYSHAVPALALQWDDKLDALMASVGRSDWMADPASLPPKEAADCLIEVAKTGLDAAEVAAVTDEARAGVAKAVAALR